MKKTTMMLVLAAVATVGQAATNTATMNGYINVSATWGGATIPVSGDTNTWDSAGYTLTHANDTFYGGTLLVRGGSIIDSDSNNRTLTLQATKFDNGVINNARVTTTIKFSDQAVTVESGGVKFLHPNFDRRFYVNNGVWAGSGNITYDRTGPVGLDSYLVLQSGNNLAGYTGTIIAGVGTSNRGVGLTIEAATSGTFGVVIGGISKLTVSGTNNYHFSTLKLGSDVIPSGKKYQLDDFTATQKGFLASDNFTGTVAVGTIHPAGTVIVVM